jgi:hypothetical protein
MPPDEPSFTVADPRRLTDEIGPGEHVEHRWAARLRELVRERGGHLVAHGLLTPEVTMIVGAELQARSDAEAAIGLADAARGAALLRALGTLGGDEPRAGYQPGAAAEREERLEKLDDEPPQPDA